MVNVLLKKQLFEIFRSYFYDAKKNKPRSKASTVSLIVLYVLLMVGVIGGMFTLFSIGLCAPLHEAGLDWLYFTLFALVGVLMGVFGSVEDGLYILTPFTTVKLLTQLLLIAALFVHIFVNVRPLLVSLGVITYKERRGALFLMLSILLLFMAGSVVVYYIRWHV